MPETQQNWRQQYPFASNFLTLPGGRMHYVDEGRGKPLLFVHGNPTWSFYWRRLICATRDRRRAVAVDHLGCGLSDKPQDYPYTLSQHIDNLCELVRRLDLQDITLVAHDWGGAIGLGAVLRTPQRFSKLVLLNTGAFPPPFCPWRIRACRTPLFGSLGVRGLNLFARAALTMATEKRERLTPEVRAGYLAPYRDWASRVAIDRFVKDIPLSPRHGTWPVLENLEKDLKKLPPRATVLAWGMKDWCFTPACLERMIEIFPHADVHRYDEVGHYVAEDAHERVTPLLLD